MTTKEPEIFGVQFSSRFIAELAPRQRDSDVVAADLNLCVSREIASREFSTQCCLELLTLGFLRAGVLLLSVHRTGRYQDGECETVKSCSGFMRRPEPFFDNALPSDCASRERKIWRAKWKFGGSKHAR
jgi:hypothetical protein